MTTTQVKNATLGGLAVAPVQATTRYLNMLVYGDSGVGKTYLAGSAAEVEEMGTVLMIDFEGGTRSLVDNFPNVQQVRVETWKQMQSVYDELHRTGGAGFGTVILDSLTEIQKFNMYQIMADTVALRPDQDPDVPSMREWGKNLEQMRKFVRGFRDLKMHTIFTALKKEDKNERTGLVTTGPSLSGKLGGEVAAYLDIVGYYYIKKIGRGDEAQDKRLLLTKKTETIIAKDRTSSLDAVVEFPTMAGIYKSFSGSSAA